MASPYRRQRAGSPPLVTLQKEAHKIAFYPLLFQAVRCLVSFGILPAINASKDKGCTKEALEQVSGLSAYGVSLLLEVAEASEIIEKDGAFYKTTRLGHLLATDESVRINMEFSHHLCYQGAFALDASLEKGTPEGLKHFGDWPTIYEGLTRLPAAAQTSWFNFDNHYSDLIFEKAIPILLAQNPKTIFDLGGNTGRFDAALLQADADVSVTLLDLPPQLEKARATLEGCGLAHRAIFHPVDVLEKNCTLPEGADIIWMSQFLDCFSEEQIVRILSLVRKASSARTKVFILEPFVDRQHSGTKLALLAVSLYFTCMANGNSRFYKQTDMERMIGESGLRLDKVHSNIGPFHYTLLECSVAER